MVSNTCPTGGSGLAALAIASAVCAAVSAAISALHLWPILSAYGPLCGETRTGALLHCPACYLAIAFTALAIAAGLARTASRPARQHAVRR